MIPRGYKRAQWFAQCMAPIKKWNIWKWAFNYHETQIDYRLYEQRLFHCQETGPYIICVGANDRDVLKAAKYIYWVFGR